MEQWEPQPTGMRGMVTWEEDTQSARTTGKSAYDEEK